MSARRPALLVLTIALTLVALVAQACAISGSVTSARSWTVGGADSEGNQFTTQVNDHSGRVKDLEVDPIDAKPGPGVVAVPAEPNALDVTWNGGACDDRTTIDITAAGAGLVVTVQTHRIDQPCDAIAIQRVLRLKFDQPVAAGTVAVRQ